MDFGGQTETLIGSMCAAVTSVKLSAYDGMHEWISLDIKPGGTAGII